MWQGREVQYINISIQEVTLNTAGNRDYQRFLEIPRSYVRSNISMFCVYIKVMLISYISRLCVAGNREVSRDFLRFLEIMSGTIYQRLVRLNAAGNRYYQRFLEIPRSYVRSNISRDCVVMCS